MVSKTQSKPFWRQLQALKRYLNRPEYFFLIAGGLFVFALCFINPPFQAVDEQVHFYRIAELGEGHLAAKKVSVGSTVYYGDTFPASLTGSVQQLLHGISPVNGKYEKSLVKQNILHPPTNQRSVNVSFEGSAVYSPVTYLPQVIGYDLARIFTSSVVITMYAGRLGDAIAWLILIWLAIKITPVGKWAFVALGLMPQIIFSAATLQADAFNTALCFLFVSFIFYLRYNEKIKIISLKHIAILLGVMSAIALSKFAYEPIFLTLFLIPKVKIRRPYITWPTLLAVPIILSLLWEYVVRNIADKLDAALNGVHYGPKEQLHYVLHHPLYGIYAIGNSIFSGASDHLIREMLGVFTWSYALLPLWVQLITVLTILFALLYQLGRTPVLTLSRKFLVIIALASSIFLIFTTFYFLWTPPGANIVLGVQGRYFLPLLPLLVFLFTAKRKVFNVSQIAMAHIVQAGSLVGLFATIIVVINKFY